MMRLFPSLVCSVLGLLVVGVSAAEAERAREVSQYGITWTFDREYEVGRFVTGDWWVVGPVTVVKVSPEPGAAPAGEPVTGGKSVYGATCLVDDRTLRNGSVVMTAPVRGPKSTNGFEAQGFDSRGINYDAALTVKFPLELEAERSLISTVSAEAYDAEGKLATPNINSITGFCLVTQKVMPLALQSAAVLTCVKAAPPRDAFRPAYAGTEKRIYETKDIRWGRLPVLQGVESVPDWKQMERLFERPWLETTSSWVNYMMLPGENGPFYGRENARYVGIASLMLMLDVPREQKERLMIGMIQYGIDLSGLTKIGRQFFPDGGHWMGRKWPILFASLMLDAPELREFPKVKPGEPVYLGVTVSESPGIPSPTTLFQEDLNTYYGKGADGQGALWQCVFHTKAREPYQEKPRAEYTEDDLFVEKYRVGDSSTWPGIALAALAMKAKAVWNHDAFFDYVDVWMGPTEKYEPPKWLPKGAVRTFDPFVEAMWRANRAAMPEQPGGKDNVKWVWDAGGKSGRFVENAKGE